MYNNNSNQIPRTVFENGVAGTLCRFRASQSVSACSPYCNNATYTIHPAATYISLNNILTGVCSLAVLWDCLVVGGQMSMSITADWNSYDSINVHGITLIGSGNGRDWHSLAFRPRNDRALKRRWRWLVGWLLSLTWWRLLIFCIHLVLLGDWPRIQLLQGKATRIYVFSRHWAAAETDTGLHWLSLVRWDNARVACVFKN